MLANSLEKAGDQILCWHGDSSFTAMLQPSNPNRALAQCFTEGR